MTNKQIHEMAEPHYGMERRVAYYVRWVYDAERVAAARAAECGYDLIEGEADVLAARWGVEDPGM